MRQLAKSVSVVVVIGLLFSACSNSNNERSIVKMENEPGEPMVIEADYPGYSTVDELEEAADLIIEGEVVSASVQNLTHRTNWSEWSEEELQDEKLNPHPDGERPEDESYEETYTVSDVVVQEVYKGDVEAEETIQVRQLGGGNVFVPSEEYLQEGSTYIMFLATFESMSPTFLNPIEAAYVVENGEITAHHSANNEIVLEAADLERMKSQKDE